MCMYVGVYVRYVDNIRPGCLNLELDTGNWVISSTLATRPPRNVMLCIQEFVLWSYVHVAPYTIPFSHISYHILVYQVERGGMKRRKCHKLEWNWEERKTRNSKSGVIKGEWLPLFLLLQNCESENYIA